MIFRQKKYCGRWIHGFCHCSAFFGHRLCDGSSFWTGTITDYAGWAHLDQGLHTCTNAAKICRGGEWRVDIFWTGRIRRGFGLFDPFGASHVAQKPWMTWLMPMTPWGECNASRLLPASPESLSLDARTEGCHYLPKLRCNIGRLKSQLP